MNKEIKINGLGVVRVYSDKSSSNISNSDIEMDLRAKSAVKAAIEKAVICKKPIALYDEENKRAYIQTADGAKKYVR